MRTVLLALVLAALLSWVRPRLSRWWRYGGSELPDELRRLSY